MAKTNNDGWSIFLLIIGVLVTLALLIVLILCLTGVLSQNNKNLKVLKKPFALSKRCGKKKYNANEITFSAAPNPGGGEVQLTWTFDSSELGGQDISFPVNIWWQEETPSGGQAYETLTLTPTSDPKYTNTSGNNYTATLEAETYFQQGTNWIAIAAEIGSGDSQLNSAYTDAQEVIVEGEVTQSAVFASTFFVACGYEDTGVDKTSMKLMWQQPLDPGVNMNEYCYTIGVDDSNDLAAMGFTTGSDTDNGIDIDVDSNAGTITVKVSGTPNEVTVKGSDCCCYEDPGNRASIFKVGDNSPFTYYISITGDTEVTATTTKSIGLTLSTFKSDCTTAVSTPDNSGTAYIVSNDSSPTLLQQYCSSACEYNEDINNNDSIFKDFTNCGDKYDGKLLIKFSQGGAAVTFGLNELSLDSSIIGLYMLTVKESVINTTPADFIVYSENMPITWNLPSGYYTPSCLIYAYQLDKGSYIPIYNVSAAPFKVNLVSPQDVKPEGES